MCEQQKGKVYAGLGFITNVEILSCWDFIMLRFMFVVVLYALSKFIRAGSQHWRFWKWMNTGALTCRYGAQSKYNQQRHWWACTCAVWLESLLVARIMKTHTLCMKTYFTKCYQIPVCNLCWKTYKQSGAVRQFRNIDRGSVLLLNSIERQELHKASVVLWYCVTFCSMSQQLCCQNGLFCSCAQWFFVKQPSATVCCVCNPALHSLILLCRSVFC